MTIFILRIYFHWIVCVGNHQVSGEVVRLVLPHRLKTLVYQGETEMVFLLVGGVDKMFLLFEGDAGKSTDVVDLSDSETDEGIDGNDTLEETSVESHFRTCEAVQRKNLLKKKISTFLLLLIFKIHN
ncbi:hypothetical protein YC2023_035591 [Brassica napus]